MADPSQQSEPKIVIDSDWKSQAKAEKERLVAADKKAPQKERARAQGGDGAGHGAEGMPAADFPALVGTLVTQALLYMGAFPDPQTGRAVVSLEYARFHIDLLGVLQEKCKGNLAEGEGDELAQALHELRLRYVELTKAVAAMGQWSGQGGVGVMGGGGGVGGGMEFGGGAPAGVPGLAT